MNLNRAEVEIWSILSILESFIFQKRLTSAAKKAIAKLPTRTVSKKVCFSCQEKQYNMVN